MFVIFMKNITMKNYILLFTLIIVFSGCKNKQPDREPTKEEKAVYGNVFLPDLSNAYFKKGVWAFTKDGILSAEEDKGLWTKKQYENFILELDFKNEPGANSGVFVYGSDLRKWMTHSVEIQITDDYSERWSKAPSTWHCGAIFGHLAPSHDAVKKPGEWNHYKITCKGQNVTVELNGETVTRMDMSKWTSAATNPDGSKIPGWMKVPYAQLPTKGHIGLQGKHAGVKVYFRNINITKL